MAMASSPEELEHDYVIGAVRLLDTSAVRLFHVTTEAPASKLDDELAGMTPRLEAAKAAAGIAAAGPVVVRYFETADPGIYRMDVGVPVAEGIAPAAGARVEMLPGFHCAAVLYWGSVGHVSDAYNALGEAIAACGLVRAPEGREWYLHFEGDASPHNVILLQLEVAPDEP